MSNSTIQHHWGLDIEWTELHQTQEQLRPQMFTYDKLAQDCIERLNEISPPQRKKANDTEAKSSKRDLLALVERHADDDPKLKELWTQIHTVPEWVDWEQIKRGQEVFFRYGLAIMNAVCAIHPWLDMAIG